MPGIFSRINKARDARQKKKNALNDLGSLVPTKPKWDDAYTRAFVEPEEVEELLKCCTAEIKSRGLDHPFLLLPFRPTSDPSAVRTFIRNFFDNNPDLHGEALLQELRMYEPMVLIAVVKWCWSRLQGGVVSWDAYELFKIGEYDSKMARDSFSTFIPLSVDNDSRQRIIFTFFDLVAAIAAHGKTNGFGGRKLSRMAAWWAFEQKDTGKGFDGGYQGWIKAADATTHLFFAYLRSLSPEGGVTGIDVIPRSLQKLLDETDYPPKPSNLFVSKTNKLVMIVDSVSPTPFALLKRASHFQYRDSDVVLRKFSEFNDPIEALTEECHRVLKAVSAANQSQVSSRLHSTGLRDASWSRFEDIGFSSALAEEELVADSALPTKKPPALRSTPASGANDMGRPTTPSWADFLSAGFVDENATTSNLLLPPDKILPPIDTQARQHSSQSHHPRLESNLEPGELASITAVNLDDAFWWVWMSSLAQEETPARKAAFGRCAIIEINIENGQWLVLEEMVAGAAPDPDENAYIAEKKGFFSWTKRSKTISRRKSTAGKYGPISQADKNAMSDYKAAAGTESQARIHAKAAQMRAIQEREASTTSSLDGRRGRNDLGSMTDKTNSVVGLQPQVAGEATSAMKWVNKYDNVTSNDTPSSNDNTSRAPAVPLSNSKAVDVKAQSNGKPKEAVIAPEVPSKNSPVVKETQEVIQESPAPVVVEKPVIKKALPTPAKEAKEPKPVEAKPAADEPAPGPAPPPKDASESLAAKAAVAPKSEPTPVAKPVQASVPAAAAPPAPAPVPVAAPASSVAAAAAAAALNAASSKPLPASDSTLSLKPKEKGGLRKLFGRKNRNSKLPENYSADEKSSLQQVETASTTSFENGEAVKSATEPVAKVVQKAASGSTAEQVSNVAGAAEAKAEQAATTSVEPTLDAAAIDNVSPASSVNASETTNVEDVVGGELSSVTTKDAMEAKQEFSRFDQGPLVDQPAFVPDSGVDEQDAVPPPIARRAKRDDVVEAAEKNSNELNQSAGPGVQDRWAQIRKNAANRAAQRQADERSSNVKPTEGEDDTTSEETIESRVARIKARVAELTGNMEGTAFPTNAATNTTAATNKS